MGAPFPRSGYPLPEDGHPYGEGGLSIFRGTADNSPTDVHPVPRNGHPVSQGRVPSFRGTVVPSVGACGTPYATDGHPLSFPWWTHILPFRMAGPPIPKGWGPGFRCMVPPCSEDCYTFVRWTGPPFPRDWEPLFSGMSAGKSFSTPDNDAPLENPRSATCRRRSQAHGLDPMASICETTRVLLPHTGVP